MNQFIRDSSYVTEFGELPPLTVGALEGMMRELWALAPPEPMKLYVRRETVQKFRLAMKRYDGVRLLGKRVRWRRDRWQVL